MRVGIAGLGRMGAAMAARLIEVGHEVTVWNRSAGKAKPIVDAGGKLAASPAALASGVETVITCLTDADAIDNVYAGPAGLLAGDLTGKLVIEMSTVRPGVQTALAEKVRAKGSAYVEPPEAQVAERFNRTATKNRNDDANTESLNHRRLRRQRVRRRPPSCRGSGHIALLSSWQHRWGSRSAVSIAWQRRPALAHC